MTTGQKIEHLLAFLGALVPLMSALASFINHKVRKAQEAGEDVSSLLLHTGSVLNVGAVNLDKAVQLAKLAKQAKESANEDQG
jgi:hypothetical protein